MKVHTRTGELTHICRY